MLIYLTVAWEMMFSCFNFNGSFDLAKNDIEGEGKSDGEGERVLFPM